MLLDNIYDQKRHIIPKFIRDAYEKASSHHDRIIAHDETSVKSYDYINLSNTLSALIQLDGRFVESFNSDLFIDWESVLDFLTGKGQYIQDTIFLFGLRKYGVDGNSFVLERLEQTKCPSAPYYCQENIYRKILALHVSIVNDEADVSLVDITTSPLRVEETPDEQPYILLHQQEDDITSPLLMVERKAYNDAVKQGDVDIDKLAVWTYNRETDELWFLNRLDNRDENVSKMDILAQNEIIIQSIEALRKAPDQYFTEGSQD